MCVCVCVCVYKESLCFHTLLHCLGENGKMYHYSASHLASLGPINNTQDMQVELKQLARLVF